MVSNTGCVSVGELLMIRRTSAVAACWARASASCRLRPAIAAAPGAGPALRLRGRAVDLTFLEATIGPLPGGNRNYRGFAMRSAAFSAIAITAALVLPETTAGITEASTTRRPPSPFTRNCESTTASAPVPIFAVQVGW